MTFIDLINLADKGWKSNTPLVWELDNQGKIKKHPQEYLGSIIVKQLFETYDSAATDQEQAAEALKVIKRVTKQLDYLIREFAEAA